MKGLPREILLCSIRREPGALDCSTLMVKMPKASQCRTMVVLRDDNIVIFRVALILNGKSQWWSYHFAPGGVLVGRELGSNEASHLLQRQALFGPPAFPCLVWLQNGDCHGWELGRMTLEAESQGRGGTLPFSPLDCLLAGSAIGKGHLHTVAPWWRLQYFLFCLLAMPLVYCEPLPRSASRH